MTNPADGNEIARMIGRLEGNLGAKLDSHGKALNTVAEEVSRLGKRVEILEGERDSLRKIAVKSAHDLSEHTVRDDQTNEAIKRHMANVDKSVVAILSSTKSQDGVLDGQNKVLKRIDRFHPVLILIASMVGAALSGWFHSSAEAPRLPAPTHETKPSSVVTPLFLFENP